MKKQDMDIYKYVDKLLDVNILKILNKSNYLEEVVGTKIEFNNELLDKKLKELNCRDSNYEEVYEKLQEKIQSVEKALSKNFQSTNLEEIEDLDDVVSKIHEMCPVEMRKGLYLKENVAIKLLEKCEPVRLLGFWNLRKVSDAYKRIDPLSILSITRHTEDDEWQKIYQQNLSILRADSFEERPVRYYLHDRKQYSELFKSHGNNLKPWGISHNKETGYINCFTLDEGQYTTPVLQFILVYMHYIFETIRAGEYIKSVSSKNIDEVGVKIIEMINSGKHRHQHLPPNTYSEHLFWAEAISLFNNTFPNVPEVGFFEETLSLGGWFKHSEGENDLRISFNIIDQVWDANSPKDGRGKDYFKEGTREDIYTFKSNTFLYHFQGGMWYDIVHSLFKITSSEMSEIVMKNLNLGDEQLIKKLSQEYTHEKKEI